MMDTLKAIRIVAWEEDHFGALRKDGKPLFVATHHAFNGNIGVFVADGKGGSVKTKLPGNGYQELPVAGWGETASEALTSGHEI